MARFVSAALILLIAAGIFLWFRSSKESLTPQLPTLSPSASIDVNKWQEYTAPRDQFKVFLPGLPHHATENMAEPKTKEKRNYQVFVASKDNGTIYSISLISFPEKAPGDLTEDFLQSFVNEMLTANPKNTIKDFKLSLWNQGKAVDFNLENAGAVVLGKAFLDGNTLYVLSVTTKPEILNPQEYNFFVNSFQLMNPAAPKKNTR